MPALHTLSALGLGGLASYALARAAVRTRMLRFHRFALVALDRGMLPDMPRGHSVRELDAHELADHAIDAPGALRAYRFDAGMTCLAAFNARGALLGVTWLTAADIREDDIAVRFLLPPKGCWDTGLWIDPRYRLSRAFAALWAGTREWMEARGLETSYSRIADYNLASAAAHRRLGAHTFGHVSVVQLGRMQLCLAARPWLVRTDRRTADLQLSSMLALPRQA